MTFKSFYNSLFQNACNWYRSSFKVLWKVFFPLNILQPWTTCSWKLRFGFFFNFKRLLQPKAVQFGIFNINLNVFLDVLLPHLLSHGTCIQFSMKYSVSQTNKCFMLWNVWTLWSDRKYSPIFLKQVHVVKLRPRNTNTFFGNIFNGISTCSTKVFK